PVDRIGLFPLLARQCLGEPIRRVGRVLRGLGELLHPLSFFLRLAVLPSPRELPPIVDEEPDPDGHDRNDAGQSAPSPERHDEDGDVIRNGGYRPAEPLCPQDGREVLYGKAGLEPAPSEVPLMAQRPTRLRSLYRSNLVEPGLLAQFDIE